MSQVPAELGSKPRPSSYSHPAWASAGPRPPGSGLWRPVGIPWPRDRCLYQPREVTGECTPSSSLEAWVGRGWHRPERTLVSWAGGGCGNKIEAARCPRGQSWAQQQGGDTHTQLPSPVRARLLEHSRGETVMCRGYRGPHPGTSP